MRLRSALRNHYRGVWMKIAKQPQQIGLETCLIVILESTLSQCQCFILSMTPLSACLPRSLAKDPNVGFGPLRNIDITSATSSIIPPWTFCLRLCTCLWLRTGLNLADRTELTCSLPLWVCRLPPLGLLCPLLVCLRLAGMLNHKLRKAFRLYGGLDHQDDYLHEIRRRPCLYNVFYGHNRRVQAAHRREQSKRSLSELVNVIAWYTECELVCKLAKLSALRRDSVSRLSRGCVTERNWLPSNMSHVFARVRDVLIEFTVNTNLPFCTAKSFQLLEIWTNPTIREAAFRSLAQTHHDSRHWPRLCTGSVSRDSHQRLTTAVVRGCNHFQFLLRSHQQ